MKNQESDESEHMKLRTVNINDLGLFFSGEFNRTNHKCKGSSTKTGKLTTLTYTTNDGRKIHTPFSI